MKFTIKKLRFRKKSRFKYQPAGFFASKSRHSQGTRIFFSYLVFSRKSVSYFSMTTGPMSSQKNTWRPQFSWGCFHWEAILVDPSIKIKLAQNFLKFVAKKSIICIIGMALLRNYRCDIFMMVQISNLILTENSVVQVPLRWFSWIKIWPLVNIQHFFVIYVYIQALIFLLQDDLIWTQSWKEKLDWKTIDKKPFHKLLIVQNL